MTLPVMVNAIKWTAEWRALVVPVLRSHPCAVPRVTAHLSARVVGSVLVSVAACVIAQLQGRSMQI